MAGGGTCFLIFGGDEYVVSTTASKVVDGLVAPGDRAFGLEIVNGEADSADAALAAVDQCLASLLTPSLFGGAKVTWLRGAVFLGDAPAGRGQPVKDAVARLARAVKAGLPAGTALVVSASHVDKRLAFYKAFKEAGQVQEFALPDKAYLVERQAADRLRDLLKDRGVRMDAAVAQAFLARVGADTRRLASELEKVAVYCAPRTEIRAGDVAAVVSASAEAVAWDLADAVGRRELGRALRLLRQLLFQKESPIGLVIGIQGRLRELLVYREAMRNGWLQRQGGPRGPQVAWGKVPPAVERVFTEDFARDPRSVHPFRAGLLAAQARSFPPAQLARCHRVALEAHERLVSSRMPPGLVLELMLVNMLA